MFQSLNFLFLLVVLHSQSKNAFVQSQVPFCYENNQNPPCGPSSWPGLCQSGQAQSPIDIKPYGRLTKFEQEPKSLRFSGYSSPNFWIKNNGHSIQVSFTPDLSSAAVLSGYGLEGEYEFAQAHFHWGRTAWEGGSEHTINGQRFPMEMHLVHFNKKKYSTYTAAASSTGDRNAIAVLGMFLELSQQYSLLNFLDIGKILGFGGNLGSYGLPSSAFTTIANNIPKNVQENATLVNERLDLSQFLPRQYDEIVRYNGSLTTPACAESVAWTVGLRPVQIRELDYNKFHLVRGENGRLLTQNYRPTQNQNGRIIQIFRKI